MKATYVVKWPNGDVEVTTAKNVNELFHILDEVGDPVEASIAKLPDKTGRLFCVVDASFGRNFGLNLSEAGYDKLRFKHGSQVFKPLGKFVA